MAGDGQRCPTRISGGAYVDHLAVPLLQSPWFETGSVR